MTEKNDIKDGTTSTGFAFEEERKLHEYITEMLTRISEGDGNMPFDPDGKTAFVLVCFNKPINPDLLPEDMTADDRRAAILASTLMVCPNVLPDEDGRVTTPNVMNEGVQAVAANMLADLLQRHAINTILPHAQQAVIDWRNQHHD